MLVKVLDLFCGVGGSALGVKRALRDYGIPYVYVGVDVDRNVLRAHRVLHEDSMLILGDAYSVPSDFIKRFDFVWASPPCETHSRLRFKRRRTQRKPDPDMRFWDLIRRLRAIGVPFVVENVEPWYGFILRPTVKVWRHCFWSNFPISPLNRDFGRWRDIHNSKELLMEFLGFPDKLWRYVTREMIRDCVHPDIAYHVATQFIERRLLKRETVMHWLPYQA